MKNKALLFCGMLYSSLEYRNRAAGELVDSYGEICLYSGRIRFNDFSHYYDDETGEEITREWILFSDAIDLEHFNEKKIKTVEIEDRFRINGKRAVNLDPGCITLSSVQLLTTKNFSHRIYLGEGIFSEITFLFTKAGFKYLDWTFPDYKSETAQKFFLESREKLKKA